ncbi:MAG TPA: M1 family metallopeptidase [Acidimicrobiales bacterium]|nr:M1 family metallopeptidase [Acidimicrobiales bacterium]
MSQASDYRLPLVARPERYEIELSVDIGRARFEGSEVITVSVLEPTDLLVLNALDLSIEEAALETLGGELLPAEVTVEQEAQRIQLGFARKLSPGEGYKLHIRFGGSLNRQLRGFYRSTFTDTEGSTHTIAATQFEATDARRAFPCWDEPELKAVFSVSLVVPEELAALSNGAEIDSTPLGGGRKRVRFADTIRMSTYLVAFIVGPFDLTEPADADGVPLRIASVPGKGHLTGFAVEAGVHALRFLSGYFEIPYPAEKIDHIAIPDFSFGAMENLGCVTYREHSLLVDPERASQLELQRVATVIAHETAHMWFGDLVTMKWWNGIWLNEAFATFMELITTDDFNPAWRVWNDFAAGRSAALAIDGLRATRPVEFDVGAPEEAEAMFDVLTYQKGGAVLRMLEQYLGAETFRKGIGHYLRTHAYGNTETTDLWDALETTSGEPVRTMMNSWIRQRGHPVVAVETGPDRSTLEFRQRRFLYDGTLSPERWIIPVTLRASVAGTVQRQRLLLDGSEHTVTFDGPVDWVIANDGASGFYRTHYSQDLLGALAERGLVDLCEPLERFDLLADNWAGVVAGTVELSEWMSLAEALSSDDDADVWAALSSMISLLRSLAHGRDSDAVISFARELATEIWGRLGWEPRPGEDRRTGVTRARALSVMGLVGEDLQLRREVAERVEHFLRGKAKPNARGPDPRDEGSGDIGLIPDVVGTALRIFVAAGGNREWSLVADHYRANDNPQEKLRFLYALSEARQPDLIERTLVLAGSDEVRAQDAPFLIGSVLAHPGATRAAWTWIEANWDLLNERFTPQLILRIFEALQSVADPGVAQSVHEFCAESHMVISGPRLDQILERLDINVALAARLRGTIAATLGG